MAMAVETTMVAKPAPIVLGSEVRRFELPDLDRHSLWFMPRFLKNFPHLNERQAIGFLRGVLYSNEYLFLFQEKGIALAQAVGSHALDASSVVWERFVWVEDPENKMQVEAASYFYERFGEWAKRKSISTVLVDQQTDVSDELIKARIGRIFTTEQKFARV